MSLAQTWGQLIGGIIARLRGEASVAQTPFIPAAKTAQTDALQVEPRSGFNADLDIVWTQHYDPYQRLTIEYADRHGEYSVRDVALARRGNYNGHEYLGVFENGRFKTLREDHILKAQGTPPLIAHPDRDAAYKVMLPPWPEQNAVFRIPQLRGNRCWTVDLNNYTCTCPEKRVRAMMGFSPGMLGYVCPHMARAIAENLPEGALWSRELVERMIAGRIMPLV